MQVGSEDGTYLNGRCPPSKKERTHSLTPLPSLLTSLRAGKKSKAVNYTPRRDQANQPRSNQGAERRADFRPDRSYNQRYRPGSRFTRDDSRNNQRYSQCVFCMRTHTPGDCPAKDLECHRCGQKGHARSTGWDKIGGPRLRRFARGYWEKPSGNLRKLQHLV